MIPDRNRGRGGAARGFMLELLDLAHEQGWQTRPKNQGVLFMPPTHTKRPGYETIFVENPHSDSHAQRVIRSRLEKAGLKFEGPGEVSNAMKIPTPPIKPQPTVEVKTAPATAPDPFAEIEKRISTIITAVSEIEGLVKQILSDQENVQRVKALLKEIAS